MTFHRSSLLVLVLAASGCASTARNTSPTTPSVSNSAARDPAALTRLLTELQSNPDARGWNTGRQQVVLAVGDRVVHQPPTEVFKAVLIGLGNLGVQTKNVEEASGFVSAEGRVLEPARAQVLNAEGSRIVLEEHGQSYDALDPMYRTMVDNYVNNFGRNQGLTINIVAQGDGSLIKLRLNEVNYPKALSEAYAAVWNALDRQLFLDKNL